MINFDYVDKEATMNDLIASQHILRRKRRSLLAAAGEIRLTLADQKPVPHKNRLVRPGASEGGKNLFSSGLDALGELFDFNAGQRTEEKARRENQETELPPKPFGEKKSLLIALGVLLTLALGALIFFGAFIPEPDPPESEGPLGRFLEQAEEAAEESPVDLMETFSWLDYTVRPGDTVEGIARYYHLSMDAVIASNNIENVRRGLIAGTKIRVPNMDGIPYTVKKGDTYEKIAAAMDVPLEAVLDANDIQSESISAGTVLFIPGAKMSKEDLRQALGESYIQPVRGRLTSSFGWRIDPFTRTRLFHGGMDLSAPHGTPVKAAASGRVMVAGVNALYGNYVILAHNNTYQTLYGHLSRITVRKGAYVGQSTIIGLVGNTGRSTGPHLHFGAYKNGRAINPLELLRK